MFEGGTRVPCVICWRESLRKGSRSETIVQSEDYYPTLLDGLGLKPSDDQVFEERVIMPALRGESQDRGAVFQFFPHNPPVPEWLPPTSRASRRLETDPSSSMVASLARIATCCST